MGSSILNLHLKNERITASNVKIIANALAKTPSSKLARLEKLGVHIGVYKPYNWL